MNSMMPMLRSTTWWAEAEPYFKLMNVMAELGANRTDPSILPSKYIMTVLSILKKITRESVDIRTSLSYDNEINL